MDNKQYIIQLNNDKSDENMRWSKINTYLEIKLPINWYNTNNVQYLLELHDSG